MQSSSSKYRRPPWRPWKGPSTSGFNSNTKNKVTANREEYHRYINYDHPLHHNDIQPRTNINKSPTFIRPPNNSRRVTFDDENNNIIDNTFENVTKNISHLPHSILIKRAEQKHFECS